MMRHLNFLIALSFCFYLSEVSAKDRKPSQVFDPCREMSIGEVKKTSSNGFDTTGLPHRSVVERIDENTYRITFNVRFLAASNYAGPAGDVDKIYREHVQNCLNEFNPKLASIDNEKREQKIELAIGADAPMVNIFIGGKGMNPMARWSTRDLQRAESKNFPSDIQCQTVVHELLHLGGLVDEYDEDQGQRHNIYADGVWQPSFECRVLGPQTSVMNNQFLALGSTVKYPLQPGHFKALVYPGCRSKNRIYYMCSQFAYRYESKSVNCKLPAECSFAKDWLRK